MNVRKGLTIADFRWGRGCRIDRRHIRNEEEREKVYLNDGEASYPLKDPGNNQKSIRGMGSDLDGGQKKTKSL